MQLELGALPGRNRSKQKTRRKDDIQTSGDPGDYIGEILTPKGRYGNETWSESGTEAPTPRGGAARGGPAPRGGVVPPGTVSIPFRSRNCPYLI